MPLQRSMFYPPPRTTRSRVSQAHPLAAGMTEYYLFGYPPPVPNANVAPPLVVWDALRGIYVPATSNQAENGRYVKKVDTDLCEAIYCPDNITSGAGVKLLNPAQNNGAITIAVLYRASAYAWSNFQSIVALTDSGESTNIYSPGNWNDNTFRFAVGSGATANSGIAPATYFPAFTWVLAIWAWDGTTGGVCKFWQNGTLLASVVVGGTTSGTPHHWWTGNRLGDNRPGHYAFLTTWNRALRDTESIRFSEDPLQVFPRWQRPIIFAPTAAAALARRSLLVNQAVNRAATF